MKWVTIGNGSAPVHTGGDCCPECQQDEARFEQWYAERFPVQAAERAKARAR